MPTSRQTTATALGHAMQRYQRSVQSFDDAVGRLLGLGPADMRCLDWLTGGAMTAGQLGTAAGLRPAATTALIDRLTAKGFVRRTAGSTDRRQVLVELTPEGRDRIWEAYGPLVAEGDRVLGHLTVAEMRRISEHLDAITELTERHRARVVAARGDQSSATR